MSFICPKCKREFSRKNNEDMHEKFCNGIKKEPKKKKITDKIHVNKSNTNTDKKVECIKSKTGLHDLVVMTGINPMQKNAMHSGYTAFCRICGELV